MNQALAISTVQILGRESISGQEIVETVKRIAGRDFEQRKCYVDGKQLLVVGERSNYSSGDVEVVVNGNQGIDLDSFYSDIKVQSSSWMSGMKYDVMEHESAWAESVEDFKNKLQKALTVYN